MSQRRFIGLAVAIGAAVPILWLAIYWAFLRGNPTLINSVMSAGHFDRVLIAVWPSWVLMIANPEERSVAIPAMAIVVNALLYGVFGWLIWFGLNRKRLMLGVVAAALIAGWYLLLRWYVGS
jgi:hypothetical protein